jgi:hypothetical protein
MMLIEKKISWLKGNGSIVTKEEIAPHEQFLPLPQCFQNTICYSRRQNLLK